MDAARLLLISAWNDSGGGFTHRLFDAHPDVAVWPFELQLGTAMRHDLYAGQYHAKYRWPFFADLNAPAAQLFDAIIEDELKSVLRERAAAKHAPYGVTVDIGQWRDLFVATLTASPTRAAIVRAYMESFFALWTERRGSGGESAMLGHCPCLILDGDEIIADFPNVKVLHIARDPRAGFADFRGRRPQMTPARYAARWNVVNGAALHAASKWPQHVHVLRLEDILADREGAIRRAAQHFVLPFSPSLMTPSWNGMPLNEAQMGPFGGVPEIGIAHEQAAMTSLSREETAELRSLTAGVMALLETHQAG